MASVGRLIPVSGGFQKSAGRVSRGRPSGSPQHLSTSAPQHPRRLPAWPHPGPRRAACQLDATRNPVVDGDQSRSELVTPSRCVVMALNPYGWNRDRSWSVSPPGITMPPCHRARHACSPAGSTYYLLHPEHDAGAHGSIGSMAPHATDGGGFMTCRARGAARAGTSTSTSTSTGTGTGPGAG